MLIRSATVGILAILVSSAVVAGCGSFRLEENPAYRSANAQLAEAKGDPAVRRYGAVFLTDAERTLDRARAAAYDPAQAKHLVYLAQRKLEIAESVTGLQVASGNLQALAEKSAAKEPISSDGTGQQKDTGGKAARDPGAAVSAPLTVAAPVVDASATSVAKSEGAKPRSAEKPAPESPSFDMAVALERSMGEFRAGDDPGGAVFAISGIFADAGRTRLTPDVRRSLTPLVSYLRDNRDSKIIVEGYTGGRGSHEDDLAQSLGIAEAVKTYLTGEGIEGGRIFTLGRGGSDALQPGAHNNRIEIGLFRGTGGGTTPALTSRPSPASPGPPPP